MQVLLRKASVVVLSSPNGAVLGYVGIDGRFVPSDEYTDRFDGEDRQQIELQAKEWFEEDLPLFIAISEMDHLKKVWNRTRSAAEMADLRDDPVVDD